MAPTDAQRKLQTLLADLGKGTSWLNMYKMTAKACEAIQPLPHNFAMPKVEPHPSDKKLARIHWQQRGRDVAAHTQHLTQLHKTRSQPQVASQCVVVAATRRMHEPPVTLLPNNMEVCEERKKARMSVDALAVSHLPKSPILVDSSEEEKDKQPISSLTRKSTKLLL